jgi:uncharacterized protein (DUF1697 family)
MDAMPTHLAFLRGVNLGPHRSLKMAELRAALSDGGFGDVRTHLQSGNVVLTSPLPASRVPAAVQEIIPDRFGMVTDVIVRSATELRRAADGDPFAGIATDPARHVMGLMADRPAAAAIATLTERIESLPADGDRYAFGDKHFYLWCPNGISRSPFFKVPWDRLGVSSTQRNWNTVTAMLALAATG